MFLSEFPCSCTSGIGESGHRTQSKMQFAGNYSNLAGWQWGFRSGNRAKRVKRAAGNAGAATCGLISGNCRLISGNCRLISGNCGLISGNCRLISGRKWPSRGKSGAEFGKLGANFGKLGIKRGVFSHINPQFLEQTNKIFVNSGLLRFKFAPSGD